MKDVSKKFGLIEITDRAKIINDAIYNLFK